MLRSTKNAVAIAFFDSAASGAFLCLVLFRPTVVLRKGWFIIPTVSSERTIMGTTTRATHKAMQKKRNHQGSKLNNVFDAKHQEAVERCIANTIVPFGKRGSKAKSKKQKTGSNAITQSNRKRVIERKLLVAVGSATTECKLAFSAPRTS